MTNMKNKIKVILILLAGLFVMSSCLKDKADYWSTEVAGKMYATVAVPTLQAMGIKPVADTVNFSFLVNIATDALPTKDIAITMKVDPDAVVAYATRTGKNYKAFPNVKIVNPSIVIEAGTRNETIKVKIWGADALSACDNFIAAVSIESVSDDIPIASNMKTYLMSLPISNPYEGSYHSTGTFVHPTSGSRVIDEDKTLSTVDCKTVSTTIGDLGDQGDYKAVFTVNADYTVTISGAQSSSQPLKVGAGWVNKYDPATKTFTVNYYYEGSGGNREIHEVLVIKP
jgi:hypothetical protein